MQIVFESLFPIMAAIALGILLRQILVQEPKFWIGMEKACFWVFFPSLLAETLIQADIRSAQTSHLALTLGFAVILFSIFVLALWPLLKRQFNTEASTYSSLYQTVTRWNGFIALAIVDKLYGANGLGLVAVALATMIPLVNIQNVIVLGLTLSSKKLNFLTLLQSLLKNPIILSCVVGLMINLFSIPIYEPIIATMDVLGRAALGAGLILVGAGLKFRTLLSPRIEVWIATLLKLIIFPGLVAGLALLFRLEGQTFVIAIICASVPTAMNGYLLAKEMGGDAPTYATITTIQTIISFITMPLLIVLIANP